MRISMLVRNGALSAVVLAGCPAGRAEFIGGGIVSLDAWNQTANGTALPGAAGGDVTVYRLYAIFSGQSTTNDQVNAVFGANITSTWSVVNITSAFPTGDIFENAAVQWDSMATINMRNLAIDATGSAPAADGDGINWSASGLTGGWFVAGSSQGLAGTKAGAEFSGAGLYWVMLAQFTVLQEDYPGDILEFNVDGTINGGGLLLGSLGLGINNQLNPSIPGINIVPGVGSDCNDNGVNDAIDISSGTSLDINGNGIPDECDVDCNLNGISDLLDIQWGISRDSNLNSVPDECELAPCAIQWVLAAPAPDDRVNDLLVTGAGDSRRLFAAGAFDQAGATTANGVAEWQFGSWDMLDNGIVADVSTLLAPSFMGPDVIVAGAADGVHRWDGAAWQRLGGVFNGPVLALEEFDDGGGPALYAAGDFTIVGGAAIERVAKWNGSTWTPLGLGLTNEVSALEVFDDGAGPALYAGGAFDAAGQVPANLIARWDGAAWSAVHQPAGARSQEAVAEEEFGSERAAVAPAIYVLKVLDDGTGEKLWAGGSFGAIGGSNGIVARKVATWDGATWSQVGDGFSDAVRDLVTHNDGYGDAVYAAGDFETSGTTLMSRLAKWTGAAWTPVEQGADGTINALASFDRGTGVESLYVAGEFMSAGGVTSLNIGRRWGCPAPPSVFALIAPIDSAVAVPLLTMFDWDDAANAFAYRIEIATDISFTSVVLSANALSQSEFVLADPSPLARGQEYFWRVFAINGGGETLSTPSVHSFVTLKRSDLDSNGSTGGSDLAILLANWGACPGGQPGCVGDIGGVGDGTVGGDDLAIMLAEWD